MASIADLFLDAPLPNIHTPAFAFLESSFDALAAQSSARLCVSRPVPIMDDTPRPKRSRSRSPKSASRPKFKCALCTSTFSRKDNLKTHQRLHSGEMPFQCKFCGRKFRWQSSARTHEQVHERHGHQPRPDLVNTPASTSQSPSSTVKVENILPVSAAPSPPTHELQPLHRALPASGTSMQPLHPTSAGLGAFQPSPLPTSHVEALEPYQHSTLQPPQPPITSFSATAYLPSSTAPLYSVSSTTPSYATPTTGLPYVAPASTPLPFAPTSTGPSTYRPYPTFSSPLYSNPPPQALFTQTGGPSRTLNPQSFAPPQRVYSQVQPRVYTSVAVPNVPPSTFPTPYSAAAASSAAAGNSRVSPPMGNSPRARRQMRPGMAERGIERVIRKAGRTSGGGLLLDLDDLGGIGEVGVALAAQQEPNAQTPQQQHGESPMFKFPNMSQHDIEKCFDPHQHQDEQQ